MGQNPAKAKTRPHPAASSRSRVGFEAVKIVFDHLYNEEMEPIFLSTQCQYELRDFFNRMVGGYTVRLCACP